MKVKCQICNKEFKQITYAHLKHHNITIKEYKDLFPNSKLVSDESYNSRSIKSKYYSNLPEIKEKNRQRMIGNNYGSRQKIKKICINCNEEFEVLPYLKKQKFCSQKCMGKYNSQKNHYKWKEKIKKICLVCGIEFEVSPHKKNRKFCSHECQHKYQVGKNCSTYKCGKIKKICLVCNREFEVFPSGKNIKFCSQECYFKYQNNVNNPNWKGGISFLPYCYKFNNKLKEEIRERDNQTCQLCGKNEDENGQKLSIHHIHYDKENCDPDLITLCNSCNGKVNGNREYWEEYFMDKLYERFSINKRFDLEEDIQ